MLISFCYPITCLIQMHRSNSKFYVWYRNAIHWKGKSVKTLNIKFQVVSMDVVKIWDHLNENRSSDQLKKWHWFFWNILYISNHINPFETP